MPFEHLENLTIATLDSCRRILWVPQLKTRDIQCLGFKAWRLVLEVGL